MKEEYELELSKKDEEIKTRDDLVLQLRLEISRKDDEIEQHLRTIRDLKSSFRISQRSSGYWSRSTSFSQAGEGNRPPSMISMDSLPESHISELNQHMSRHVSEASVGNGVTLVPVNSEEKSGGLEKGRSYGRSDADHDDPLILDR